MTKPLIFRKLVALLNWQTGDFKSLHDKIPKK